MSQLAPSRRTANLLACLVLLAASVPWTPVAEARAIVLSDNFDVVPSAPWTWSGAYVGSDTTAHTPLSSLSIKALSKGQVVSYERNAALEFAVSWNYTVSLYFWNEAVSSDSDAWFNLTLADGTVLTLDPTYGPGRAGVSFRVGTTPGYRDTYGSVYSQLTWYQLRINIDPVNHTTNVELRDLNDNLLWNSPSRAIPESATGITRLGFYGTWLGTDPLRKPPYKVNFDTLLITTASAPRAPTATAAPGPGAGEITLTWQPPADDGGAPIHYYNVYGGNESNKLSRIAAGVVGTTYTDQGRGNGVRWYYKVAAVNTAGESDFSNETSARTFSPPSVPQDLAAAPGNKVGDIALSWKRPTDDGGAQSLTYLLYRATIEANWTFLGSAQNVTNYTDTHLVNGTRYYYAITAANPSGESNATGTVNATPRPDYATRPNASVNPLLAWSNDTRTVDFTYEIATSQCAPPFLCATEHEWRIYQDGSLDGADGSLLASGTDTHSGHGGPSTYAKQVTIQPVGEAGAVGRIKVAVNPRTGSTEWNVTWHNITFDLPQPGYATGPTAPMLTPAAAEQGGTLTIDASYSVFQQQCSPSGTCPVTNTWLALLDGTSGAADGTLIAYGTNVHPAHGETETYAIQTTPALPDDLDSGLHTLKILVKHNDTASWQAAESTFTLHPCSASTSLRKSFANESSIPVPVSQFSKEYTFRLGNYTSIEPLRLYNACLSGSENEYEYGRGGARIAITETPRAIWAKAADLSGTAVFFIGTDGDGTSVVGDSASDCIAGPFIEYGVVPCPPDATGHVLVFLYEDYYNANYPAETPYVVGAVLENVVGKLPRGIYYRDVCVPADTPPEIPGPRCAFYAGDVTARATQLDSNNNGYGDAWENLLCKEAGYKDMKSCANEIISQLVNTAFDTDGDGLNNILEFRWDTYPIGPISKRDPATGKTTVLFPNAKDYDGDNWLDGDEKIYWNDEGNDASLFELTAEGWNAIGMSPRDPDHQIDHWPDGDELYTVHDPDVDNDGVPDGDEYRFNDTYPQYPDSDCKLTDKKCSPPPRWFGASIEGTPGSGDVVNDKEEFDRWAQLNTRLGITNASTYPWDDDEIRSNMLDPDSDGDDLLDGEEWLGLGKTIYETKPYRPDSDFDGLLDGKNVIVDSADWRYNKWASSPYGITYDQLDFGRRSFKGELDHPGMNPNNADSDDDGIRDGEEVPGNHGLVVRERQEYIQGAVIPNQELDRIDSDAWRWLNESASLTTGIVTSNINLSLARGLAENPIYATHGLANCIVNDPSAANPCVEKTATSLLDHWAPDPSAIVSDVKECIPVDTNVTSGAAAPSPDAIFPAVNCLVGVVDTVVAGTLLPLATEAMETITDTTYTTVEGLQGRVPDLRIPQVDPILEPLLENPLEWDPTDLGPMPTPPNPFENDSMTPSPVSDIFWPATPFPQFFADTTDNMLTGEVYRRISSVDAGDPLSLDLIGTIDAGKFNVLIHDGPANKTYIRKNATIGSACFVDLQRPQVADCAPLPLDAELAVQADLNVDPISGKTTPKVTIKSLAITPQHVLAAAFMQIPDSTYVVALGNDATPAALGTSSSGMPAEVQFSLGTNALDRAVGGAVDPKYLAHFVVPQPNGPARFVASYFSIDQNTNPKRPIQGERADLAVKFTRVPSSATANLYIRAAGGGARIEWTSAPTLDMDVTVAARGAHGGASADFVLKAEDLPQAIASEFVKTPASLLVQHTAGAIIPQLTLVWNGSEGGKKFAGGTNLTDIPTSATLTLDAANAAGSFTTDTHLGAASLISFLQPASSAADPPCRKGAGEYLTHKAISTTGASCTALSVTSLKSITAAFGGDLKLDVKRTAAGGPLLVMVDDETTNLLVDATAWPQGIDVSTLKTAGTWSMTVDLGQVVSGFNVTYIKPTKGLDFSLVGLGLPARASVTADYATGAVDVTATTSTRIGDVSLRYAEAGYNSSLGTNDGVILLGSQAGGMKGVALRLREFRSADLNVHPTTGLSFLGDTLSPHKFSIRWENGVSRLSADLPQLPASATATFGKSDAEFNFDYHSSVRLSGKAHLKVLDGRASVLVNLTELPKDLVVRANFIKKSVSADASSDLTAEVALAGQDAMFALADAWDNYLSLDRVATLETDFGSLPQFHVKLKRFLNLSAELGDGINLTTRFNGTPGTLGVRYNDVDGWLSTNVTSLPAWVRFNLTQDNLTWRASPDAKFSMEGAAQVEGFNGRWAVRNIPSQLDAEWFRTGNATAGSVFYANVTHNAAERPWPYSDFEPSFYVDAKLNLTPNQPASYVRLDLDGIPNVARLEANGPLGILSLGFARSDGVPCPSQGIEAAYVADARDGLPWFGSGAIAYARLSGSLASQFFVRLPDLQGISVRTMPDAATDGKASFDYSAKTAQPAWIDVADEAGTSLRGHANLPTHLSGDLLVEESGNLVLDLTASETFLWDMNWTKGGYTLIGSGSLARTLHAERVAGSFKAYASDPMDITLEYGRTGFPVRPEGIPDTDDYAFVNFHPDPRIGVRFTDFREIEANPATGRYYLERDISPTTHLGFSDGGTTFLLRGAITGMPTTRIQFSQAAGTLAWTASKRTGGADLWGRIGDKAWRLDATGIPNIFDLSVDAAKGTASLLAPNSAFDSLEVGYAGDARDGIPTLAGPGFALDTTGSAPRFAARLDDLKRIEVSKEDGFRIFVDRTEAGGDSWGEVRTPDHSVAIHATSLPRILSGQWDGSDLAGGMRFRLGTDGGTLGTIFANYTGNGAVRWVQAAATNPPSEVDFRLTKGTNGFDLKVDRSLDGSSPRLVLDALTDEGLTVKGDLWQLPRNLTIASDELAETFILKTQEGAISGELLASQGGARSMRPPGGAFGASLSRMASNEHAWIKVQGLQELNWTRDFETGHDHVHVAHSGSMGWNPVYLAFEDAVMRAEVHGTQLPGSVTIDLTRNTEVTRFDYVASGSAGTIVLQASQKDGKKLEIDARLKDVPDLVRFSMYPMEEHSFAAYFRRSQEMSAPDLWVDIDGPDGSFIFGSATDLPRALDFVLDPNPGEGWTSPACAFKLMSSTPIPGIDFLMAKGEARTSPWLRGGDQWVGIDLTNPKAPTIDARLRTFVGAEFCFDGGGAFHATTTLGGGDVRISYLDSPRDAGKTTRSIKGEIKGMAAGKYEVRMDRNRSIVYEGQGTIPRLHLEGRLFMEGLFEGRGLSDFTVDATNVPPYLKAAFSAGTLTLDSKSQVLGSLHATVNLLPKRPKPPGTVAPVEDVAPPSAFRLDAGFFQADTLYLQVTDSGQVRFPSRESQDLHRVVLRNSPNELQVGIDLHELRGADLVLDTRKTLDLQLDKLVVKQGSFRLLTDVDGFVLTVYSPNMAPRTEATINFDKFTTYALQIQPSAEIQTLYIAFGPNENTGWNFVLNNIPTSGIGMDGVGGAAFRHSLKGGTIGRLVLDYIEDVDHRLKLVADNTADFLIEGDADGSNRHQSQGRPRFVDMKTPYLKHAEVHVRWGDKEIMEMSADEAVFTGTVLVVAIPVFQAGSDAWSWSMNKVGSTTAAKMTAKMWKTAKEWVAPDDLFRPMYTPNP